MARPRKLTDLQLQAIKQRLVQYPLKFQASLLRDMASAYKVNIRTLSRRLNLERKDRRGRKTKHEKRDELTRLRT
jgi:hypothetical protein